MKTWSVIKGKWYKCEFIEFDENETKFKVLVDDELHALHPNFFLSNIVEGTSFRWGTQFPPQTEDEALRKQAEAEHIEAKGKANPEAGQDEALVNKLKLKLNDIEKLKVKRILKLDEMKRCVNKLKLKLNDIEKVKVKRLVKQI